LCYFDVAQSYSHICAKRELDRSREGLWGKPNLRPKRSCFVGSARCGVVLKLDPFYVGNRDCSHLSPIPVLPPPFPPIIF
jgi:hypothetical protein